MQPRAGTALPTCPSQAFGLQNCGSTKVCRISPQAVVLCHSHPQKNTGGPPATSVPTLAAHDRTGSGPRENWPTGPCTGSDTHLSEGARHAAARGPGPGPSCRSSQFDGGDNTHTREETPGDT